MTPLRPGHIFRVIHTFINIKTQKHRRRKNWFVPHKTLDVKDNQKYFVNNRGNYHSPFGKYYQNKTF